MLLCGGMPVELVGNIGRPPLARIDQAVPGSFFVHEFSSHQLAEVTFSPHIAVLLNIVPEHLDYYADFDEYASAKENITRFQNPEDFLVFNADYPVPASIAARSRAALRPFSLKDLRNGHIIWPDTKGGEVVLSTNEIPLAGRFNVQNVLAAVHTAALCGVGPDAARQAIRQFRGLPHRLELVGVFHGITFYDDSIATVPEAALAALEALGENVETLILGGHERNLDFSDLGVRLPAHVRNVILFPPTGRRIWQAIEMRYRTAPLPSAFFVESMEQAVQLAYAHTGKGKICLLSPASPSFGTFKDYKERGDSYKKWIRSSG
jgi:UDP-N-acetylmuramoylalanine--D-glutamate ligase